MRLIRIELGSGSPVAFFANDDGDQVAVPVAVKASELLAEVAAHCDWPSVERLSDVEIEQLRQLRAAYALTPTRVYEGPDGRAREQISLQLAMRPLVEREKRAQLVDELAAAAAPASSTPNQGA